MKCYNNINLYYLISLNVFLLIYFFKLNHIIEYNPDFIVFDFLTNYFSRIINRHIYVTYRAPSTNIYINGWIKYIIDSKPVGMVALYHHWFDLYFSNLAFPIFMALWVLPSLQYIYLYTLGIRSNHCSFTISHSGWSKTGHDNHHKYSQWFILSWNFYG